MQTEHVFLKFFNVKLISYKKLENGQVVGTGILNPLLDRLKIYRLIFMMLLQANFYKTYDTIGKWKGKMVANTFAPPVGSRPMLRALKGLIKSQLMPYPFPVAMTFAITYNCQCKCVHCSAGRHYTKEREELSTEEAKKLIDDAQKLGVTIIAFTGGEPLLREDLFELISHVNKKKAMPVMFTNGQYLTEENVEKLFDAGLYSLFLSIDTPNPEEHNKLRGMPGLFETAIEGLKRVKSKGIFAGFSSYATRSGTEKGVYKKIHELGVDLGLHNIIYFDCVPTGNMLHDTSEMLTPELQEEIHNYSAEVFRNKIVPPLSSQSWQNSVEAYLSGIGCLAANIQYYASAYGDISPCDFSPLSFGNIRNESLKKIWMRMVKHPAFSHKSPYCRMQDKNFRHFYIDPIPDNANLPYSMKNLPRVDYREAKWDEIEVNQ
ncbi:MAG: radical SAM/SPASM domain-containing protein [Promethearchaeota archaeon]|jgi:MoaA/NifB/PqqE/SkfB family radical SAM enzyme